ncbi:MAG: OmpA family protein [Flavobacteriaceae bacterium]|nr:OmpA family protein [Flavobacteriaceae bacterium]
MKKFNQLLLLILLISAGLQAQEEQSQPQIQIQPVSNHYTWQLGVSMFATDHTSARGVFDGFFDFDDYSVVPYPAKFTLVRGLNKSFDLDASVNFGQVDNKRLNVENEFMVNGTLGLRYRLANGYILNPTSWFDPYLRLGAGIHHFDYQDLEFTNIIDLQNHPISNGAVAGNDHFTVTGGVGINFWFAEKFGANIMSEYYHMRGMTGDNIDFFQHSAGLVFRFGKLDRDGDGIEDKDDECPDTPGLAEFNGCPDTDGDGLPDHLDECPLEPGPIENIGCPYRDRDGDGILDDVDECPDVPGIIDYNGCPPPIRVIEQPEPEQPKTIVFQDVLFEFDSYRIKMSEFSSITEAAEEIKSTGGIYYIDGHTDVRGADAYNDKLSQQRAQAVKDALVQEGADPNKLIVRGMGERFPVCNEDTEECHQLNRRVEILRKE